MVLKIKPYDNLEKKVVGIHIDAESRVPGPVFDEIYRVIHDYFFSERECLLEGWNLFHKPKGRQGEWYYSVFEDFDAHEAGESIIDFALKKYKPKPVASDTPHRFLQSFALYINNVADELDITDERDRMFTYIKNNFSMRNVENPRYRINIISEIKD